MTTQFGSFDASRMGAFKASQFGDARNLSDADYRPAAVVAHLAIILDGYWYNPSFLLPYYSGLMTAWDPGTIWAYDLARYEIVVATPQYAPVHRGIVSGSSWWPFVYGYGSPRQISFPNGVVTPPSMFYRGLSGRLEGPLYSRWDAADLVTAAIRCIGTMFPAPGAQIRFVVPNEFRYQTDTAAFYSGIQAAYPGINLQATFTDQITMGHWLFFMAYGVHAGEMNRYYYPWSGLLPP